MDILAHNTPVQNFAGVRFRCKCGNEHVFAVEKITVDTTSGVLATAPEFFLKKNYRKLLVIADANTAVFRGVLVDALRQAGLSFSEVLFPAKPQLVPDERALGLIAMSLDKEVDCIVAVGSGTINDLARYTAYISSLPYVIFATAASMDGYTSSVSPLIKNKKKITFEAVTPQAVFADIDTVKNAPLKLLRAGIGDVIGKYCALADWQLSSLVSGEYYCEQITALMRNALERCAAMLQSGEVDVSEVLNCLLLSGIAMAFAGNSRPASGAEHHIAHYWEMDALKNEREHALHGEMVGVASVTVARLYEILNIKDKYPAVVLPDAALIERLLKKAGAFHTPQQIGISRTLFIEAITNAMHVRDRYTILRYVDAEHALDRCAASLADEMYR